MLSALAEGHTAEARLWAAIRSNIAAHYERPEYQAILLPVASLPVAAEMQSVGWRRTIEQLRIVPDLDAVGDLLPVVTAIGTLLRMAVFACIAMRSTPRSSPRLSRAISSAGSRASGHRWVYGSTSRLHAGTGEPARRDAAASLNSPGVRPRRRMQGPASVTTPLTLMLPWATTAGGRSGST
jgi:hypothetical protein